MALRIWQKTVSLFSLADGHSGCLRQVLLDVSSIMVLLSKTWRAAAICALRLSSFKSFWNFQTFPPFIPGPRVAICPLHSWHRERNSADYQGKSNREVNHLLIRIKIRWINFVRLTDITNNFLIDLFIDVSLIDLKFCRIDERRMTKWKKRREEEKDKNQVWITWIILSRNSYNCITILRYLSTFKVYLVFE